MCPLLSWSDRLQGAHQVDQSAALEVRSRPSDVADSSEDLLDLLRLPMNSRRTDRNAAIAPDTCGAAMLVPVSST